MLEDEEHIDGDHISMMWVMGQLLNWLNRFVAKSDFTSTQVGLGESSEAWIKFGQAKNFYHPP